MSSYCHSYKKVIYFYNFYIINEHVFEDLKILEWWKMLPENGQRKINKFYSIEDNDLIIYLIVCVKGTNNTN